MIEPYQDRELWSQEFSAEITIENLFSIQKEVSGKVSQTMDPTNPTASISKNDLTKNLEAYSLHAEGRWHLDKRTEEGMRKSLPYFRKAIDLDPEYSLAWVGLADALILLYDYGYGNQQELLNEAKNAVTKAMDIAPEMAESNCSLALWFGTQKNGPAVVKQFQRAIQIKPSYADAHNWLAWIYEVTDSPKEALVCSTRAVELNPLSLEALSNLSISKMINGDTEKSILTAKKIQEMQPDWTTGYLLEAIGLYHLGNLESVLHLTSNLKVNWSGNLVEYLRMLSYIKMGLSTEALILKDKSDEFGKALFHAAKEETTIAFSFLDKVKNWDYGKLISLYHLFPSELNEIRKDERYSKIKKRADESWNFRQADRNEAIDQTKMWNSGWMRN